MGNFIELLKTVAADSQRMTELKDKFNTDAQNMNLNWPKLSMEKRRALTTNMNALQTLIAALVL